MVLDTLASPRLGATLPPCGSIRSHHKRQLVISSIVFKPRRQNVLNFGVTILASRLDDKDFVYGRWGAQKNGTPHRNRNLCNQAVTENSGGYSQPESVSSTVPHLPLPAFFISDPVHVGGRNLERLSTELVQIDPAVVIFPFPARLRDFPGLRMWLKTRESRNCEVFRDADLEQCAKKGQPLVWTGSFHQRSMTPPDHWHRPK